jgi:hypothetical protein
MILFKELISSETGRTVIINLAHVVMVSIPGGKEGDVKPYVKLSSGDVVNVNIMDAEELKRNMLTHPDFNNDRMDREWFSKLTSTYEADKAAKKLRADHIKKMGLDNANREGTTGPGK